MSLPLTFQPMALRVLKPCSNPFLIFSRGLKQTRSLSNNQQEGGRRINMNTAPIEFTANLLVAKQDPDNKYKIQDKAMRALRCNDTTAESNQPNTPFQVRMVDKEARMKDRIEKMNAMNAEVSNESLKKSVIEPYLQLSKPRLTVLVMLSAICSYALSPYPATILELLSLTVGTTLCSASANAINMGREPDFDRQMVRTQARPVVRGVLAPKDAFRFAATAGTLGSSILYFGVNPTVAFLGFSNIVLYSWIYTSLKRKHIINTWVGALVGAIPPLMGWAAASPLTHPGAWCLAGLLYSWQFPHFNTLSHNIRSEYKNAGYVMTAWKNPKLNARVALRYSLLMFPLCFGLSYYDITDWYYQIDSSLVNLWMSFWALKFYLQQRRNYTKIVYNDKTEFNKGLALANVYARKTFWVSVLHLPAILILAILHKKGQWDWIFENKDNQRLTS